MKAAEFLVAMRNLLRSSGENKDEFEVEVSLGSPVDGPRHAVVGVSVDDNCGGDKPIVVIEVKP